MKGLILAAGSNGRIFSNVPNPLIKICGKPAIMYGLEKLVAAGINDIGIVINEDDQELFTEAINVPGAVLTYIFQNDPRGAADAIKIAASFIGSGNFIVILGDTVVLDSISNFKRSIEDVRNECMLALQLVEDPTGYNIIDTIQGRVNIEEKPDDPKTNIAVMGVYGFSDKVLTAAKLIYPSKNGEFEIAALINLLVEKGYRSGFEFVRCIDIGTVDRLLYAEQIINSQRTQPFMKEHQGTWVK